MNWMLKVITGFYLFLSAAFVAADAVDEIAPDTAARMVANGEILSLDEVFNRHPFLTENRLLDMELEQEVDEPIVYEFQVLHRNGNISGYEIDAVTGELLQETFEE